MNAVVITVSDRASRGEAADTAGPAAVEVVREWSFDVVDHSVVSDDIDAIVFALRAAVDRDVHLIVTVGGTGCAERDNTPEATRAVVTREVPGIPEAMRDQSAKLHPYGRLSRSVAGIAGRTLVVNVPGSERGAVENLTAVASLVPHAVRSIRGTATHPDADAARERQMRAEDT